MEALNQITAKKIGSAGGRSAFLAEVAGRFCVGLEGAIFDAMSELSTDYSGGMWDFFSLSNGGFFMVPGNDSPMKIFGADNWFDGVMSVEAAGITASLIGINRMAWRVREDRFSDLYYRLRDFALAHPEADLIMAATD